MRPSARWRIGRRRGAVTVGLTVLGMLVSTTATHAADPDRQAAAPPGAARTNSPAGNADKELARAVSASGGSVPVTLITGDRVHVGVDENGKPVVQDTRSARRPDGLPVVFHTLTRQGKLYVVPDDALALVGKGLLDWSLFDLGRLVTLVAAGRGGTVPTLVTYTDTAAATAGRASKVAGASGGRALPSINGRSLNIADDGRWWREVRGKTAPTPAAARSAGSLAGVKKVWLNGLSHVDLEQSVPQIGAPVAWERGYDGTGATVAVLDTGIDATHPDVSRSIAGQVDFTGSPTGTKDGHGHGTHVASTVLGSGAASKGLRKGVAPGAKLLVGKVCDDNGQCPDDGIIAAMDWAAHSGAKVVNMSLGGEPTDGTDPMSQALNRLSRDTGTLFVVAAGNSGYVPQKVVSPGSADDALTVAAIDKSDAMASFSNRGPRIGDGAAKPDIAAPGVGIVAARAAGTTMGSPVDEYYTTADGTSMATPHVAGAAAVVAQQHPELTGQQIKALLMDTATDLGHDLYAQGTGRVDLAVATNPRIVPKGNLNFGRLAFPHSQVTKKLTYTNRGDKAVPLHLTMSVSFADGRPAAAGMFTLGTDKVVVPAHGSAEVPVSLDAGVLGTDGAYGGYNGLVSARDDSGAIRLSSGVHTFVEAQKFPLTLNVVPPKGATDVNYGTVVFTPVDDQDHLHTGPVTEVGADSLTKQLYHGTYAVQLHVNWRNAAGQWQQADPIAPEVGLAEATTVTLDLSKAKPLNVQYPESTETYTALDVMRRVSATGAWTTGTFIAADYTASDPNWWVLPTDKVGLGTFTHDFYNSEATPVVSLRTTGGGAPLGLSARYATPDASISETQGWPREDGEATTREAAITVPRLPVKGRLPVVHAGTGSAADLAKVDARGKLVLLTPTDICGTTCDFPTLRDKRVAAAAAAGAVGVLVASPDLTRLGRPEELDQCPDGPQSCPAIQPYAALPIVTVPYAEAEALIKRIEADRSPVRITLDGSTAPRVYAARFHDEGRIRPNTYRVEKGDLDRVDHHFHAARPGQVHQLSWKGLTPADPISEHVALARPTTRQSLTTFVKREDNAISRFTASWADVGADSFLAHNRSEANDMVLTGKNDIHWNEGPSVPGAVPQVRTRSGFMVGAGPCAGCRQGDAFYPTLYLTGSGGGRQALIGIVDDEWLTHDFTDLPSCGPVASPLMPNLDYTCDFRLLDASGHEIERHTEHLPDQDFTAQ
ncbi:S8 family serine peptidase [Streptomyces anthocyanicus]|uniref:S8 family serine peptidase n=1 Tax=Streptomyces anthocyanicus TaxID=68174 RepID=UPI002F90B0EE|nr:S8 family serine peptidase [Streptomyces anthocyanicus]